MLGFLNKFFWYRILCVWFIRLPSITFPKVPFFNNLFSIFSIQNSCFPFATFSSSFEFQDLDLKSNSSVSRAIVHLSMVNCPWVPFVFHFSINSYQAFFMASIISLRFLQNRDNSSVWVNLILSIETFNCTNMKLNSLAMSSCKGYL